MKFTAKKLEKAFTGLLENEKYPHHFGITIKRTPDEVLIEEDLQKLLLKQCEAEGLTVAQIKLRYPIKKLGYRNTMRLLKLRHS
jgi:type I restriction enzyme R subunit